MHVRDAQHGIHCFVFLIKLKYANTRCTDLNVSVCFGRFHEWQRKFCYSLVFMLIRPVLPTVLWFEYSFEVCLLASKQTNIKFDRRYERGLFSYSFAAFPG